MHCGQLVSDVPDELHRRGGAAVVFELNLPKRVGLEGLDSFLCNSSPLKDCQLHQLQRSDLGDDEGLVVAFPPAFPEPQHRTV